MITIFYLVPVTDRPSWGMGIIYDHVYMLSQHGFKALVIKESNCSVPSWLDLDVPVKDYSYLIQNLRPSDILVVPEAMLNFPYLKQIKCRKILFIQAAAYLFESMPEREDHRTLGFEHTMIIMPHMEDIVKRHVQLPYSIVPPYLADYFFNISSKKRKRQILLYPKFHQIDYSVVKYLVERHIRNRNKSWLADMLHRENWSIKEIKGLQHHEVAKTMKEASFYISLNTFEALNTSVTEAMAAGCLVFCYEGFGPRDYLSNNHNAIVFANNEAYKLAESVCDWIDNYDNREKEIADIRENGYKIASSYSRNIAKNKLIKFYSEFITG